MSKLAEPPPELNIPTEDWQQTPASVRKILVALYHQVQAQQEHIQQLAVLEAEVAELREQVNRNSGNSSQPPSSDAPSQQTSPSEDKSKKHRRGGQPGHKGHHRLVVPLEQVDQVEVCKPTVCQDCGTPLSGDDPTPYRYQRVEIPPPKADITEYQVHCLTCPNCGSSNRGELPCEAATSQFGVNLSAWIIILIGVYRLSKRQAVSLLETTYSIQMSPGSVINIQKRASQALAEPVAAAYEAVKTQPARYIDDTGWKQGGQTRKSYLWVVVTPLVSVFHIVMSRAGQVAKD